MRTGRSNTSDLCESCRRRPAEFAVFMLSGRCHASAGEKRLCVVCARDNERIMCGDGGLSLTDLLHALINEPVASEDERNRTKVCPGCGNTLEEARSTGMLGCSACYVVFREEIDAVIAQLHGFLPRNEKLV